MLYWLTLVNFFAMLASGHVVLTMEHGQAAVPAKTYVVNLDLPPIQRWQFLANMSDAAVLEKGLQQLLQSVIPSDALIKVVETVAADLDRYLPQPFADEIRGLSEASTVPLGDVVLCNIIYDVSAFDSSDSRACTSIVATDKKGKIFHGRNLDYNEPEFLKNLTIQVDFTKNGKTLYMGTTYIGYIGLITGCRPGGFSITGDERDQGHIWDNLLAILENSEATFFHERRVLEEATTYDEAFKMLKDRSTIAPVYFIVGGIKPNEGAIIVRNAHTLANVTFLGQDKTHPWYLVETNYDPWEPAPASDDRRDAAIKAMNTLGQDQFSAAGLYKVLSSPLVFNAHTTYTTIMSAADASVYNTMIRFDWP